MNFRRRRRKRTKEQTKTVPALFFQCGCQLPTAPGCAAIFDFVSPFRSPSFGWLLGSGLRIAFREGPKYTSHRIVPPFLSSPYGEHIFDGRPTRFYRLRQSPITVHAREGKGSRAEPNSSLTCTSVSLSESIGFTPPIEREVKGRNCGRVSIPATSGASLWTDGRCWVLASCGGSF